jgi:hypothetical protein
LLAAFKGSMKLVIIKKIVFYLFFEYFSQFFGLYNRSTGKDPVHVL